ncbi:MAG: polyisoprenoid-binding protein [Candidatus Omnitrophica bacterium]|nr:polyisoprenoid-binding protein [Candidatus Omnitrophota bacterium]MBI2495994.1 polyisoprenoid-binding protein [Candidatus Omnitrophota bacterium]MBI3083609.1 polyisoprenoid-binding protein [Candidatus Omnitrophota bacterium]
MRRGLFRFTLVGLLIVAGAPRAWATTYAIDQDHTTVSFKIRHLVSFVRGTFNRFEGRFDYVPDQPEQWKADVTIQAASIDTRVPDRDNHLRSKDFLDVEQHPTITFTSTGVTDVTPTSAKLHGRLTIHGIEKPVVLDLTIHGEGKDPWGKIRSGFTATTTMNRKDFGIAWNKAVETGQLLVGEEVEVILEVEGVAPSPA